jgi:SPX domain protein involved in polyphosphate accumulation
MLRQKSSANKIPISIDKYRQRVRAPDQKHPIDAFVRIEDKILMPAELRDEFASLLDLNMHSKLDASTEALSWIESNYLDSDNLDLLKMHFEYDEERFKLRTRRYSPSGIWNESSDAHAAYQLEMKSKTKDKISKKFRFGISRDHFDDLCLGRAIRDTATLVKLNGHIPEKKLLKRLKRVNRTVEKLSLRPQCRVTYLRRAYENGDLRVTFDDQLSFTPLAPIKKEVRAQIMDSIYWPSLLSIGESFVNEQHLIVEVKHDGNIPDWMVDFFRSHGLEKVSFSKYCHSIAQSMIYLERIH